jgi:hypothetical protein
MAVLTIAYELVCTSLLISELIVKRLRGTVFCCEHEHKLLIKLKQAHKVGLVSCLELRTMFVVREPVSLLVSQMKMPVLIILFSTWSSSCLAVAFRHFLFLQDPPLEVESEE